jgi:hypothetical protein
MRVQAQDVDPSLQTAYQTLFAAWQFGDAATWDRLVDSNALIEHTDGRVHVKADEVEHIRSGASKPSPRIDNDDRVTLSASGLLAAHRYVADSGLVTEIWRKLPNGAWVLMSHWEGFGKHPFLDGIVHV